MAQPRPAPDALEKLPITFRAGDHTLTLTLMADWRWTVALDDRPPTGKYMTQAEAWEAGVREAFRPA
jgi:hypothetical protein